MGNMNEVKAIFLDVDGVLNCQLTSDTCDKFIGIEDKKVSLLSKIVKQTKAIIVLVSSWKENWTNNPMFKDYQDKMANYLDSKLEKENLYIYDKTIDGDPLYRGRGILRFIKMMKEKGIYINKYVILDDEYFDYQETNLLDHLIKTSFYQNGLEEIHVRKVIEKLC